MAGQRFEGRTLEEALENAAEALGVAKFQVEYHVVVEKRGFLGGLKRIVIEAEGNPDKQPDLPPAATARDFGAPERPARGRGPRREDRPRREREPREPRAAREPRRPARRDAEPEPAPPQGPRSEAAEQVASWCGELFVLASMELEIRTVDHDDRIEVNLYGPDASQLTDRDGELLESLQLLGNKSLADRLGRKLDFDARGFRGRRTADLEQQARAAADRVRAEGREHLLPAMTPSERRIVHLALQDEADVATVSRGDGFFKRVAIVPRDEARSGDAES